MPICRLVLHIWFLVVKTLKRFVSDCSHVLHKPLHILQKVLAVTSNFLVVLYIPYIKSTYRRSRNFRGDLIFMSSAQPWKLNPQKFEHNESSEMLNYTAFNRNYCIHVGLSYNVHMKFSQLMGTIPSWQWRMEEKLAFNSRRKLHSGRRKRLLRRWRKPVTITVRVIQYTSHELSRSSAASADLVASSDIIT